MSLRIEWTPYRLLFKRPFGTAHGLRDGTDAVFLKITWNGYVGYGEVTLPPYLSETIPDVLDRLRTIARSSFDGPRQLLWALDTLTPLVGDANGCRAGLSTALIDLISKAEQIAVCEILDVASSKQATTLMTIGISAISEVESRLSELPASGALKLKVGDPVALARIERIKQLDDRMLFMDANQGLSSVNEALELVHAIGEDRLLGIEQPFGPDGDTLARELGGQVRCAIYADESMQDLKAVERQHMDFGGVNIKLMKCGGLDKARQMITKAQEFDLRVMLGSMSESSLGCTAMAHLAGLADLVDLDGPWLLANDPFTGIGMAEGLLIMPNGPGLGVHPKPDFLFEYGA